MRLIKAVSHILAIVMLFAAAPPAFGQETVTSYGGALLADTCSTYVNDLALTGDSVKNVKKTTGFGLFCTVERGETSQTF